MPEDKYVDKNRWIVARVYIVVVFMYGGLYYYYFLFFSFLAAAAAASIILLYLFNNVFAGFFLGCCYCFHLPFRRSLFNSIFNYNDIIWWGPIYYDGILLFVVSGVVDADITVIATIITIAPILACCNAVKCAWCICVPSINCFESSQFTICTAASSLYK